VHQENTLQKAPGVFLGKPDDGLSQGAAELIKFEEDAISAVLDGDAERALMAGGECAQRVSDLPPVQELVDSIVQGATETIRSLPEKHL